MDQKSHEVKSDKNLLQIKKLVLMKRTNEKQEKALKTQGFQGFCVSNQDGKTIAEKALFYKGFGHF